jgi:hypothetical protein
MGDQRRDEVLDALFGLDVVIREIVRKGHDSGLSGVHIQTQLVRCSARVSKHLDALSKSDKLLWIDGLMPSNLHEPAIGTGNYMLAQPLLDGLRDYIVTPFSVDDICALNDAMYSYQVASGRFEPKSLRTADRVHALDDMLPSTFNTSHAWSMHRYICSDPKSNLSYVASSNYLVYLLTQIASPPPGRMHDILKAEAIWTR